MNANPEQSRRGTWLAKVSLVLAVALVIARATIQQGLRDPDPVLPGGTLAPRQAGPTAGLVLDLLMCLPALLMLLRRVIDPQFRLKFTISHGLFISLSLLAAASSFWSADKFAAAVTSMHFVAAAALLWAISQIVRSWTHVRLISAACFAILLIGIAQSVIYRMVDLPDMIRSWEETRMSEFARRGWEPNSFQARQFEIRVRAGELLGFNISPNSFAALMVMLATVCAGAAIQRIVDRDEPGWAMAIIAGTAPVLWVLYYTGGRTAAGAAIIAAFILLVTPRLKRRGAIFSAATAAILAGAGLMITHGIAHGSLIHSSLTFRWRYWVGAMRVFLEHPLSGIGWSNFGDYYLGARLPIASEEVKDPHNLIVRAFVELGIVGGLLMVGWLARMAWEITSPAQLPLKPQFDPREARPRSMLIFWIAAVAILTNVMGSVDFAVQAPDGGWFAVLELFKRGLFFVLAVLGMAIVLLRSSGGQWLDERPAPWMLSSMGAAVAAFMVCNLVDFSIFEPGPMYVVAMLIGTAIGARHAEKPSPSTTRHALPALGFSMAMLCWIVAGMAIVAPVAIAERQAQEADVLLHQNRPAAAAESLTRAFDSLWIPNSDYALRAAIALIHADAPANRVRPLLDSAVQANPMSTTNLRTRAQFELRQVAPDAERIRSDYQRILTLDPANVMARLEFAAALARFGDRSAAIDQYRETLRYNDLLDPEEPKRLTEAQIAQINRQVAELQG